MHRTSLILLPFLAVLVAVVTGCGGAHRYDGRLVAADSLMWDAPDSALAIVSTIDSLAGESDRAYHDLLLTQARYKAYQEITTSDDSAITRAVDYYRVHSGEREKLTRAYLYKGAVMEELGHVDSAMYYYKTAEANADKKDYTNLGQINTRIAALYRDYYADTQICYDKNHQALKYYKLTGNKPLQLSSLLNMGSCSGVMHKNDAELLLNQASQIAIELNDSSSYYQVQELLCRQLSTEGKSVSKAKQIALHCLNDYRNYVNHNLLLDLAEIYTYCGMPDSARYYLDMVVEDARMINLGQVKTRKYLILSDISRLEGDTVLSSHYDMLSHQVSDSILNNKLKYQIQQIENDKNHAQAEHRQQTIHGMRWLLNIFIAIAIIALLSFALYHYKRMRYIKSIIKELQNTSVNTTHKQMLEQVETNDNVIGQFVKNMVSFMQTLIDASEKDGPTALRERVKEGIGNITTGKDFWNALRVHIDQRHDGLISHIAQNPKITAKDLKFIELCCFGFNYLEIAIIMGYTPKYFSQKRKEIAAKLQLDMPLQDYLNQAMNSHNALESHQ